MTRKVIVWGTLTYTLGLLVLLSVWHLGVIVWWVALPNIVAPFLFLPLVVLLPLAFWVRRGLYLACLGTVVLLFALNFGERLLPRVGVRFPEGEPLRVMTFNHRKSNEQLEAVRDVILRHDADIVALQELSFPVAAMAHASLSEAYPYRVLEPAPTGSGDGLGILSRFPIDQASTHDAYRGQHVQVRVSGKRVTLINVHLNVPFKEDSRGAPRLRNFHPDQREHQMDLLLADVAGDGPLVVLGDFNLSDNEPSYRRLAASMTDAYRRTQAGFGFSYPVQKHYRGVPVPPLARIDYVWLKELEPYSAALDCQTSSDHCALIADLALP